MKWNIYILLCFLLFIPNGKGRAEIVTDTLILNRIFDFPQRIDTTRYTNIDSVTYTYSRYSFDIKKRNFTLLTVPTLFAMANSGKRKYLCESYSKVTRTYNNQIHVTPLVSYSNIPRRSTVMPTVVKYLQPKIYEVTMIQDYLLSPFNRQNKRFYRYKFVSWEQGQVTVVFTPKVDNTQLVKGSAIVDYATGRILSVTLSGEHDMVRFNLNILQQDNDGIPLIAKECELKATFKFVGNKMQMRYKMQYDIAPFDSTLIHKDLPATTMGYIRTDTLSQMEQELYREICVNENALKDSISQNIKKKENFLWDVIGDNLVNKIRSSFGSENQGYVRINPLLNPLYMGYSERKGFTYKFDLRGSYRFSPNTELSLRMKSGYVFKEKQFYFSIPVYFFYNKKKNFYTKLEVGNGNRINSSVIADMFTTHKLDSIKNLNLDLYKFREDYFNMMTNYDFSSKLSVQLGIAYRKRSAMDKEAFKTINMLRVYKAFAPMVEIEYRPKGWKGPIISLDYERSIKDIFQSNTEYERWELDMQYIKKLTRLQAISARFGVGLYTLKGHDAYFLDFENFRENSLPGGWNDDWSGEFELLNSNWYNSSNYYFRTNMTYESPILLTSWIPFVGRYIEMERLYISALFVRRLHPYIECGYGFTTRLLSMGFFVANKNGKFDGFGCKFGFELFRRW